MKVLYICFGTYTIEILEIIFYFSLIVIRVTASKLFQNFVYSDKMSLVVRKPVFGVSDQV